jgi:hypothetical protein
VQAISEGSILLLVTDCAANRRRKRADPITVPLDDKNTLFERFPPSFMAPYTLEGYIFAIYFSENGILWQAK